MGGDDWAARAVCALETSVELARRAHLAAEHTAVQTAANRRARHHLRNATYILRAAKVAQ